MEPAVPIHIASFWAALVLLFCIFCVAFFSSSEAALMSANKIKIRHLVKTGNQNAKAVERVISRHDRLFGTILTTENMFIILASSLAGAMAFNLFGEKGIAVATAIMTVFIVIFGEITPKTYAAQNAEKMALLVARPMEFAIRVTSPIISLFAWISTGIIRLLSGKTIHRPYFLTEEEIKTVIDVGEKEGVLEKSEKEMIDGVFAFGDTLAREVMVPRVDMVCLPHTSTLKDIIKTINETGHSRLPIYEDNIDNVIGVVYAKDLLPVVHLCDGDFNPREILRPCHYVPGSQKVIHLLADLQKKKLSMAIIIDEFGGTAGLVTMEKLLEVIVGEIEDEYDFSEPRFEKIDEFTHIVDARASIEDVNKKLLLEVPRGDYTTIGGFVAHSAGKLPALGTTIEEHGVRFTVEKLDGYKVSKIRIRLSDHRPDRNEDEISEAGSQKP